MAQPHFLAGMETGNERLSGTPKFYTTWTSAICDKFEISPHSNPPLFSEVYILN